MKKFKKSGAPIWGRGQLSDELRKYGYVFSMKRSLCSYVLTIFGMICLGRFYHLGAVCQTILCGSAVFMMPLFLRNAWKSRYLQRKFSDMNIYMEQYLYSFQKTGKILETLKEVHSLFEVGNMKTTLETAIDYIEHTFHESDVEAHALGVIEREYSYMGLRTMHGFSLQVEKNGGDYHRPILLLLESRRLWADRIYALLREKRKSRIEIFLSILTSLGLCSFIYMLSEDMGVALAKQPLAQWVTLLVLLVDLVILYLADKKLCGDYMKEREQSMEDVDKLWQRFEQYKVSKKWTDQWGYRIVKKKLSREIEKQFPQWLMEVSLLLQSENVQVTIFKTYESAPRVLQYPLKTLILELQQNPADIRPYLKFLQEFTLPEVRSTMKMLYSLSEGKGGDADEQIQDMIHRNQVMIDKAEKIKNEDQMAGMYALFLAPQITAGAKLLADMVLLMVVYMGHMMDQM